MATNKWSIMIIFLLAMVATLATSVSAKVFIVGDDKGWTLNFDYHAWAYGKQFVVGDKLGMHPLIYNENLMYALSLDVCM